MTDQNTFVRPAFQNGLEVVAWFNQQGRDSSVRLRPRQLQMLLYIAQGLYAAANHGGMLMPSRFVATSSGPIEPNLYAVLQEAIDPLPAKEIAQRAEACLNLVWKKFGTMPISELEEFVASDRACSAVAAAAPGAEIPLSDMADSFYDRMIGGGRRPSETLGDEGQQTLAERSAIPTADSSVPRMTPDGKIVKKWVPTRRVN